MRRKSKEWVAAVETDEAAVEMKMKMKQQWRQMKAPTVVPLIIYNGRWANSTCVLYSMKARGLDSQPWPALQSCTAETKPSFPPCPGAARVIWPRNTTKTFSVLCLHTTKTISAAGPHALVWPDISFSCVTNQSQREAPLSLSHCVFPKFSLWTSISLQTTWYHYQ